MFDSVVEIKVCKVESVFTIAPVQHIRSVVRYEEAEGWREVIGSSDERAYPVELDILAIARQDTLSS